MSCDNSGSAAEDYPFVDEVGAEDEAVEASIGRRTVPDSGADILIPRAPLIQTKGF